MHASQLSYLHRFRALSRNARLYLISNTLQAVSAGAIGVLYTLYLTALGYSASFVGLVVFLGILGGGLGILPAGPLVDRFGWKTMLLWSDFIGGIAIAVQLLVPLPAVILLTSLGVGASVAIVLVINVPLLAANSTPHERTALFGLSNALNYLALAGGSLLAGGLSQALKRPNVNRWGIWHALGPVLAAPGDARAYQLALVLLGLLAVPSILPILLMSQPHERCGKPHPLAPSPRLQRGEGESCEHAEKGDGGTFLARGEVSTLAAVLTYLRLPSRSQARQWLTQGRALAAGVIGRFSFSQAFVGFGAGIFSTYANLYFVRGLGASVAVFGVLSAVQTGLVAVAALASAPLADRFGKLRAAVVTEVLSLPFLVLMGFSPPLGIAVAAFLLHSAFMNVGTSPLQVFLMEAVPDEAHGLASEVYNGSWQVALGIGAAVGGALIGIGGYGLPFFAMVASYGVSIALLLAWFLPRHTHSARTATAEPERSGVR